MSSSESENESETLSKVKSNKFAINSKQNDCKVSLKVFTCQALGDYIVYQKKNIARTDMKKAAENMPVHLFSYSTRDEDKVADKDQTFLATETVKGNGSQIEINQVQKRKL